jgi:hypothetical protein
MSASRCRGWRPERLTGLPSLKLLRGAGAEKLREGRRKAVFLTSSPSHIDAEPARRPWRTHDRHHREPARRNGVDTATLFATLDAVNGQNEIAKFQFRASNTWVYGAHSRSTVSGFYGALQEIEHKHATVLDADHPTVLVGEDNAPTPIEFLLHGIAACLTAGTANIAAARRVDLAKVTSTVEGDINLLASSGCPMGPSETATSRSRSPSTSKLTPMTGPFAGSSSSPACARPYTTRSPIRRLSSSRWSPADPGPSPVPRPGRSISAGRALGTKRTERAS